MSPESVGPLKHKHVRMLEHMLNHRLGVVALHPGRSISTYYKAEIGALAVAVAELNDVLAQRK